MTALTSMLDDAEVVVCAGSGGVGKTTMSAALGLAAARRGRRVVVVTIDPARRLAEALGLGTTGLGDAPTRLDTSGPGELWAAMLDTRATFDAVVARYATPERAAHIYQNRFYRNLADALSGTREYMAAEKLYELAADPRFDLVVVDTPPSRNALDFVEAPTTLTSFLDHRLYRLLMAPTKRMTRAVGFAASTFVRTVSKVVGSDVVEEAVEFFRAFDGLEAGFRERAHAVAERLRAESTSFVLVTSPRSDTLDEAGWLAQRLSEAGIDIRAVILNRVQPRPTDRRVEDFVALAAAHPGTDLATLSQLVADQAGAADLERLQLEVALGSMADEAVYVPILGTDVRDLDGLREVADLLVG